MKIGSLPVYVLAAVSMIGSAHATILYSNLSNPNPNVGASLSQTLWATTSFSTDNNSYTLADVIVALEGVSGGTGVNVSIYSNVGNQPGSQLKNLGNVNEASLSTASYTQQMLNGGNFQLTANT